CTYTEKLHNGVWAARSWNPSGHIEFPGVGSTESAFILGNADGPWGGEWQWVSSTELDDDSGSSRHADD
ncbi:MAG: hypothetical protein QGH20_11160, partial [Candidatus Latescibacteria bacterium]|nr:hypothetical protein [Candidatus Latescibacterota bacterium]